MEQTTKDYIILLLVTIGLLSTVIGLIKVGVTQYNDYDIEHPSILIECDDVYRVVNDIEYENFKSYVCYNEHMVYEFITDYEFDNELDYDIERYYIKTNMWRWLFGYDKEIKKTRITVRSD